MSRTYRNTAVYTNPWGKVGRGRYYKRAYNKAVRRAFKGTGKTGAIAYWLTELKYRGD